MVSIGGLFIEFLPWVAKGGTAPECFSGSIAGSLSTLPLLLEVFGLFSASLAPSVRKGCEMLLKASAAVERGEKRRVPSVREGCRGVIVVRLLLVERACSSRRSVSIVVESSNGGESSSRAVLLLTGGAKSSALAGVDS